MPHRTKLFASLHKFFLMRFLISSLPCFICNPRKKVTNHFELSGSYAILKICFYFSEIRCALAISWQAKSQCLWLELVIRVPMLWTVQEFRNVYSIPCFNNSNIWDLNIKLFFGGNLNSLHSNPNSMWKFRENGTMQLNGIFSKLESYAW